MKKYHVIDLLFLKTFYVQNHTYVHNALYKNVVHVCSVVCFLIT